MELKIKRHNVSCVGKELEISLFCRPSDEIISFFTKLKEDTPLKVKIAKWNDKRSLNANGYFHSLSDKLAEVMHHSKPYMKNLLIGRYGQSEKLGDIDATVETNIPYEMAMESVEPHLRLESVFFEDGEEKYVYTLMRNTRTYDTKEFSILLDGTIQEAKAQGIPTASDKELDALLEAWEHEKHS